LHRAAIAIDPNPLSSTTPHEPAEQQPRRRPASVSTFGYAVDHCASAAREENEPADTAR